MDKISTIEVALIFAVDAAIVTALGPFDLEWWVVLALAVWVEVLFTIWLVSNLELMRRWPPAGRFFYRREVKAEMVYHKRAWIRKFHFWGVLIFTFLPLSSGVIVGTFLAKFTGMGDRRAMAAVILGTVMWAAFLTMVFALSIDIMEAWLRRLIEGV